MRRLKILAAALAVATPAAVLAAPSLIDSLANYLGGRSAPASLNGTEFVGVVQNGATTKLTLAALASYLAGQIGYQTPTDVTLSGSVAIPSGSHQVNAAPGSVLTLPASAAVGTTEYVSDYAGGALANPIAVAPSGDAAIVGYAGSFSLTVPFQATGFRRTATAWQPY